MPSVSGPPRPEQRPPSLRRVALHRDDPARAWLAPSDERSIDSVEVIGFKTSVVDPLAPRVREAPIVPELASASPRPLLVCPVPAPVPPGPDHAPRL